MPSKKGLDQAITWLRSKMAEKDTLDAINAELCYNVICDLQKKRKVIGALYHQAYELQKEKREELEELYFKAAEAMRRYSEQQKKDSEQTTMNI